MKIFLLFMRNLSFIFIIIIINQKNWELIYRLLCAYENISVVYAQSKFYIYYYY